VGEEGEAGGVNQGVDCGVGIWMLTSAYCRPQLTPRVFSKSLQNVDLSNKYSYWL
jgi:hypothetical protein